MEFTLICPTDGRVELGLEDIAAVVFLGSDSVEVRFLCPQCGSPLRASLHVPDLLGAAIEAAHQLQQVPAGDDLLAEGGAVARGPRPPAGPPKDPAESARRDAYCEYFRRQLDGVECVEDLLAELD